MQLSRRPLAPGELDHELLWLSLSLGGLAATAAWFALHLPWPQCIFLALTGHPCVTCGATRSAIAFFHGDLLSAWKWNPLFFVFLCSVTLFDIYAAIVLVLRMPRFRISNLTPVEKNLVRGLVVTLLAANWSYLLLSWQSL
jgi:hypothetical protein